MRRLEVRVPSWAFFKSLKNGVFLWKTAFLRDFFYPSVLLLISNTQKYPRKPPKCGHIVDTFYSNVNFTNESITGDHNYVDGIFVEY